MKNLLLICKGMPNKIKSAGDVRALRMIQILKKEYDKVDVIASSADYGDGDVRSSGAIPHLNGNTVGEAEKLIKENNPEVIIIEHWTISQRIIDFLRKISNAKIIIDSIDIEFLRLRRKLEYDSTKITQQEVDRVRKAEIDVYKKADALIVASKPDKEEISKHGNFKFIELPCLFQIDNSYAPYEGNKAYFIGNWTHGPNLDSVLYLCEKVIPNIDVQLYIVGKHIPPSVQKHASDKIIMHGAEYELHKFLPKMNMLLTPVLYGAGINGKIGEALAFGVPVVTTPLGAKPYNLQHKNTAMVANNPGEFIDCVRKVKEQEHLRSALSINGKKLMEEYTPKFWKQSFLDGIRKQ